MLGQFVDAIYPPRCLTCLEPTQKGASLCASCWSDTVFISGTVCHVCGTPLIGEAESEIKCDNCIVHPPVWDSGRAAVLYEGNGRKVVLALKHGDRLDMARPLAEWMVRSGADLLQSVDVVTPVPLHWRRLFKRRYNQSAELARHIAEISDVSYVPDLLVRKKATPLQDGLNRQQRYENQRGVFSINPRHSIPKRVLIVDDVLTTGATISACAEVLRGADAEQINALVLARVAWRE